MAMSANLHITDIEDVEVEVHEGSEENASVVLTIMAHTPTGFEEVNIFCKPDQLEVIEDTIAEYREEKEKENDN